MMPLRSIHVVADGRISFFLMVKYYSVVCINHIRIHSSIDGHLSCTVAPVSNAALNVGCRGLFHTPHPIHFSLSPLLLSWSKFPFLAASYISLPPVLSLAINFLTQFQFGFIPKECMYIVLKFGIKN